MYEETLPYREGSSWPRFGVGDIVRDQSGLHHRVDSYFSTTREYVLSRICPSPEYDPRHAAYLFTDENWECIECVIADQDGVEANFALVASHSGSVHCN